MRSARPMQRRGVGRTDYQTAKKPKSGGETRSLLDEVCLVRRVPSAPLLPKRGARQFIVSHADSPACFYVRQAPTAEGDDEVDAMASAIAAQVANRPEELSRAYYPVGATLATPFGDCTKYYRVQVVETNREAHAVKVYFVDRGNTESVFHGDLRLLPFAYLLPPAFAIRCSLDADAVDWSDAEKVAFRKCFGVGTKQPVAVDVERDVDGSGVVRLFHDHEDTGAAFLASLVARRRPHQTPPPPPMPVEHAQPPSPLAELSSLSLDAPSTAAAYVRYKLLPPTDLVGHSWRVWLTTVRSPNDFDVQLVYAGSHNYVGVLNDLEKALKQSVVVDVGVAPCRSGPCAVSKNEGASWQRGDLSYRWLSVEQPFVPTVVFVDYATEPYLVDVESQVRAIPHNLVGRLPVLAVRCRLASSSADRDRFVWSAAATDYMSSVAKNDEFDCLFLADGGEDGIYDVELVDVENKVQKVAVVANEMVTRRLGTRQGDTLIFEDGQYPSPESIVPMEMAVDKDHGHFEVVWLESVASFYLQFVAVVEQLRDVGNRVQAYARANADALLDAEKAEAGQACIAYLEPDDSYFRATLMHRCDRCPLSGRLRAVVFFNDFGNTSAIDVSNLLEFPRHLLFPDGLAVKCRVNGIRPTDDGSFQVGHAEKIKVRFALIVCAARDGAIQAAVRECAVRFVHVDKDRTHVAELTRRDGQAFGEYAVQQGWADWQLPLDAARSLLPSTELVVGQSVVGHICCVEGLLDVHVQLPGAVAYAESVSEALRDFYEKRRTVAPPPNDAFRIGGVFAVKVVGDWRRARIDTINLDADGATVLLVDVGGYLNVKVEALRALPPLDLCWKRALTFAVLPAGCSAPHANKEKLRALIGAAVCCQLSHKIKEGFFAATVTLDVADLVAPLRSHNRRGPRSQLPFP